MGRTKGTRSARSSAPSPRVPPPSPHQKIMTEEMLTSKTLPEAKEEIKIIYLDQSSKFEEITKEEYDKIEKDEREGSHNHTKIEKLGKEADIIALEYYKYLPEREIAFKTVLRHKNGSEREYYFTMVPNLA